MFLFNILFYPKSDNGAAAAEAAENLLMSADGGLKVAAATKVTADGTYATQTAITETNAANQSGSGAKSGSKTAHFGSSDVQRPTLQAALFKPHFLVGVVLSSALVKIYCRYSEDVRTNSTHLDASQVRFLLGRERER